ncbi:MAG: hypothetical protein IRY98_11490 [Alicyclobacillaceae bacterium]|nr:hypothetical protein [Alicyclobacillaceae bacterium]
MGKERRCILSRESTGGEGSTIAAEYVLRCLLCGQMTPVSGEQADQLRAAKEGGAYICDLCQMRVRYESEQRQK